MHVTIFLDILWNSFLTLLTYLMSTLRSYKYLNCSCRPLNTRTGWYQAGLHGGISNWKKMEDHDHEPPSKRRRLSLGVGQESKNQECQRLVHSSLSRPISPPPLRRAKEAKVPKIIPSPFQLTWVRDLPEPSNIDAVSLRDILGDPLIAECWEFNYLHDLDFLMDAFDQDVRDLVKVHVIHGFWKSEDQSRLALKVSPKPVSILYETSILIYIIGPSCKVLQYYPAYCIHARNVRYSSFQGISPPQPGYALANGIL